MERLGDAFRSCSESTSRGGSQEQVSANLLWRPAWWAPDEAAPLSGPIWSLEFLGVPILELGFTKGRHTAAAVLQRPFTVRR